METCITIYSPEESPRLSYVADFVFGEVLGLKNTIAVDSSSQPVLVYQPGRSDFGFSSNGLLFETGVNTWGWHWDSWQGLPALILHSKDDAKTEFDLFAAIFFLLTRYEEYWPAEKDEHGRYLASNSVLYDRGVLTTPIVNAWIDKLAALLKERWPALVFKRQKAEFIPTMDIDQAYAFKGKGMLRYLGAAAREVALSNWDFLLRRINQGMGQVPDPFDCFEELEERWSGQISFFWHVGDWSKYDKPVGYLNEQQQRLIRWLSGKVGLHPSYASNSDKALLATEKRRLESLLGAEVTSSRQHYIKLSIPTTYEELVGAGITADYSMGYPEEPGFRAGTSYSYRFYNLRTEEPINLRVWPFCVMDVTLARYKQLKPDEANALISTLVDQVERYGGVFIPIWHNESLSKLPPWQGWKSVFEHLMQEGNEKLNRS